MKMVRISDFGLVSYLVATGLPVVSTSREGRRVSFHFRDDQALREEVDEFRYGDAMIRTKDLLNAQRELKSLIFDRTY